MKKILIAALALLLLSGCSGKGAGTGTAANELSAPAVGDETTLGETNPVWTKEEMPVSVDYSRMWEYSASAQTDDPDILAELVAAIQSLEIGEKSEWVTEDYTDILTFTFADGDALRLEFENQSWVTENGERYEVDGLGRVRAILDELVGEIE